MTILKMAANLREGSTWPLSNGYVSKRKSLRLKPKTISLTRTRRHFWTLRSPRKPFNQNSTGWRRTWTTFTWVLQTQLTITWQRGSLKKIEEGILRWLTKWLSASCTQSTKKPHSWPLKSLSKPSSAPSSKATLRAICLLNPQKWSKQGKWLCRTAFNACNRSTQLWVSLALISCKNFKSKVHCSSRVLMSSIQGWILAARQIDSNLRLQTLQD